MTADLANRIRSTSAADLVDVYCKSGCTGFYNLMTALVVLHGPESRKRNRYVAVWDLVQRLSGDSRFELRVSGGPGMFSYRVKERGLL